ncbi:MAG: Unknown protein [uncultured Thiotrichaceae bacterium]|uniref:Uncharacterized protein n=1 Tax=uncultured Thiotrichaceae bacterium TaxID=298394 RepID=A0A6S6TKL7_9GAMM|nr:MAG: Unknown protein [uncultured Thiotrichaceae bacterium]
MNKGAKLLVNGIVLGLLTVFAVIGIKSMLDEKNPTPVNTIAQEASQNELLEEAPKDKPEQTSQDAQSSPAENEKTELQLIDEFGGLQLTIGNPANPSYPPKGHFVIKDNLGIEVASVLNTDTASFDLKPGVYEVMVIIQGQKSARMVEVKAGEYVTEHFALNTASTIEQIEPLKSDEGILDVQVRAAGSNVPLKANIYVQLANGKHVAKQNYVEGAAFNLSPGTYRVTVKTKGKKDLVRNLTIEQSATTRETFNLQSLTEQVPMKENVVAQGTLAMAFKSSNLDITTFKPRFMVNDRKGKGVARVAGFAAEVKLSPGVYTVLAILGEVRRHQEITIQANKLSKVEFNTANFGAVGKVPPKNPPIQMSQKMGVLQLVAISGVTQQPLKVNYTVSTLAGKVLKAADAVSIMEAAMKPQDVMVDIAYQDIKGRERITVKAGEPSVFTFTITPSKPKEAFKQANTAPNRLEDVLLERLQLELKKRLAQ